ncbi:hypothetical protein MPSEU_000619600 [Mayamaea pseudoterrestris]|nr:hypothetical protein MPSEU_000619600 [Mayamaea pseudoterrestris]
MKCHSLLLLILSSSLHSIAAQQCGTSGFSIAGSSTVYPIATAWAAAYSDMCTGIKISPIDDDGSSNGAARVCGAGEDGASTVEIGDMSRQWREEEATQQDDGYTYDCVIGDDSRSVIQIDVALDGISVVASGGGTAASCIEVLDGLTIDQLRWMFSNYTDSQLEATGWDPASIANSDGDETTHLWSELNASCEATEILAAGQDETHGTFDYFSETLFADMDNGEGFANTYNADPDGPGGTVSYVESNPAAVGYVGYAYYYQNGIELYVAAIENDAGDFVTPGADSVVDGTYNPLSRTIYMNLLDDPESLANTVPFIQFGFSSDGADIVATTGYVPIPNPSEMLARLPAAGATQTDAEGSDVKSSSAQSVKSFSAVAAALVVSIAVTLM